MRFQQGFHDLRVPLRACLVQRCFAFLQCITLSRASFACAMRTTMIKGGYYFRDTHTHNTHSHTHHHTNTHACTHAHTFIHTHTQTHTQAHALTQSHKHARTHVTRRTYLVFSIHAFVKLPQLCCQGFHGLYFPARACLVQRCLAFLQSTTLSRVCFTHCYSHCSYIHRVI